jgi:hypothetical protein
MDRDIDVNSDRDRDMTGHEQDMNRDMDRDMDREP